jgi:hypothetical protein
MASVTIGGQKYEIPVLSFKQVKKLWPILNKVKESQETEGSDMSMELTESAIEIVAIGLSKAHPEFTVEKIEEELLGPEIAGLKVVIEEMLAESGFLGNGSGEVGKVPAPAAKLSTETSTP